MIVCVCNAVTDEMVVELVRNGMASAKEVMQACQAGQDCGSCASKVHRLVREKLTCLEEKEQLSQSVG